MKKEKLKRYNIIRSCGESHGTFTDEKTGELKEYAFNHLFCEKIVENEKGIEISRSAVIEKLSPDTALEDVFFDTPCDFYYDKFGRVALCHIIDMDSDN